MFESMDSPEAVLAGPGLAAALAGVDLARAEEFDLVEVVAGWERVKSYVEACQARVIAELAARPLYASCANPREDPHDQMRAAAQEISAALRWSPSYAETVTRRSAELVHDLPATLDALEAGRIDGYQARVMVEETRSITDLGTRRGVEADVLAQAGSKTGAQLRALLKRKVIAADPDGAERRHEGARRTRGLTPPQPLTAGLAQSLLSGPAPDLAAFYTAVDAAARARRAAFRGKKSDRPSLEEFRFDVIADLGYSALANGHLGCCNPACTHTGHLLGTRGGKPVTINVTMSLFTLMGLDEQPGELAGYGPITAETARRLAAEGTWRRLLTDPVTGALLDVGTTRYTPPPDLAEHVILRDMTCRFPTCTWPAESCDLDHTVPHRPDGSGGATSAAKHELS